MTLNTVKPDDAPVLPPDEREQVAQATIDLAAQLLQDATNRQQDNERAQANRMAGMMHDANGKTFTIAMSDQAFRSHNAARIANQIKHLIDVYGVPKYFSWWERNALRLGSVMGQIVPDLVVPFIVAKLRQETQSVILPSEERRFKRYLQTRREGGTRLNINQLGEAILGEEEAGRRLEAYLTLLARPDVEYISVKISSVFSQINLVAFDETVKQLEDRLRKLYRTAMKHQYVWPDGRTLPKFVNLDMEEYRDLHLTVAAFKNVLDEPEFLNYRAGIVLQAYLPDSAVVQRELTEWALDRVARGGAPIKVRIVKGANLAMERVEASWHGWQQAPYRTKEEVDANFKRMVTYGCHPDYIEAVNLGIASHNLFDLAYGIVLRDKYSLHEYIEFEMLEGMANHQARAVQARANGLLLYAPVVKRDDFHSAIAYLVRRLDENTAEENFLHDLFGLRVGSADWQKQRDMFLNAFRRMDDVGAGPQRLQNRQLEQIAMSPDDPFRNEPDTDWALPQNQAWIRHIRDEWQHKDIPPIPLQIDGELILNQDRMADGDDPSRPGQVRYRYALATAEQINAALDVAVEAQSDWANKPIHERKALLVKCAEMLAKRRDDFLGAMMLDGGKRPPEADPEVSEAIDFANYYARSLDIAETDLKDAIFTPFGTVVITPPWNFPMAIPTGGVLAALMAGNTVIFKPAPEATLVGWHIVNALWDAGIPQDVLQFVPTTDDEVGQMLITDERVDAVILTGAYATGRMFKSWKPNLRLFAETSGKNSMIITGMADHDQAIKDLVKSAFGHAGQKCSASSLAILEAEVYDNADFRRQLRDAAASLKVGPAWDLTSMVTPVIREPGDDLKRGLTQLDEGEEWLLEPQMHDDNPNLWSPGIKLGVKRGSWYHHTECFGPVLGLMRADELHQAIDMANDVEYGLTSGLQSLDDREIDIWREKIQAGNAYINRGTTGAIVQRQPFGGWKKSVFGYAKAGGPNYVLSLGIWREKDRTPEQKLAHAKNDYPRAWRQHFGIEHDPSQVLGEANIFRYRPIQRMGLRLEDAAHLTDAQMVALAAQTCGVPLTVSVSPDVDASVLRAHRGVTIVIETEDGLMKRVQQHNVDRLRIFRPVSQAVYEAANEAHVHIIDAPVVANGRLELRHYLHEQAVSHTTHRYGNILDVPEKH